MPDQPVRVLVVEDDRKLLKLLTQLIAKEEVLDENRPAEDLLGLEGMTERLAYVLAERGIRTQEELAELSTDELIEVDDMGEEVAAALIMTARAPWFDDENKEAE